MWFRLKKIFAIIGPGFITASVVIGPGSVSTNSKIGAIYGYELIWILVASIVSMMIFTVMGARFGVISKEPVLKVVSEKYGRWLSVFVGISAYFMSFGFGFGNNLGVATAMTSLTGISETIWIFAFSGIAFIIIFVSLDLYNVLEKIMMVLVAVMIFAFMANLFYTKPSGIDIVSGFIPKLPQGSQSVAASLAGTTFCINAALYQAYLVRDKGWGLENYKRSVNDSIAGVITLGFISLMIMVTSASALHPRGLQINSAGDMAVQLETLFGSVSKLIFCIGLWGAAFSSLMINSFLGGGIFSDSLGWGGSMRNFKTKLSASFILIVCLIIAVFFKGNAVNAIVFAQASTLFGFPAFALILMLVMNNKEIMGEYRNKWWENIVAFFGICLLFWMMLNTFFSIIKKI